MVQIKGAVYAAMISSIYCCNNDLACWLAQQVTDADNLGGGTTYGWSCACDERRLPQLFGDLEDFNVPRNVVVFFCRGEEPTFDFSKVPAPEKSSAKISPPLYQSLDAVVIRQASEDLWVAVLYSRSEQPWARDWLYQKGWEVLSRMAKLLDKPANPPDREK